jgi:phage protein D
MAFRAKLQFEGKEYDVPDCNYSQVSHIGRHGAQNHIRISGCSPTVRLDGSRTMDSFTDATLSGIVSEAVSTSGNGGKVTVQPKFTGKIDYTAQYGETCFQFLNRLSRLYGEWFFYDGETCYFGKQEGETESVTYEVEMQTFDMSANLLPTKMKQYHYMVHDAEQSEYVAADPRLDGYPILAQNRSSAIYTSEGVMPLEAPCGMTLSWKTWQRRRNTVRRRRW